MTSIYNVLQHVQADLDEHSMQTAKQIRQAEHKLAVLQKTMQGYRDEYTLLGNFKQSVADDAFKVVYQVEVMTNNLVHCKYFLNVQSAKNHYDDCAKMLEYARKVEDTLYTCKDSHDARLLGMTVSGSSHNDYVAYYELRFHQQQPQQPI